MVRSVRNFVSLGHSSKFREAVAVPTTAILTTDLISVFGRHGRKQLGLSASSPKFVTLLLCQQSDLRYVHYPTFAFIFQSPSEIDVTVSVMLIDKHEQELSSR